ATRKSWNGQTPMPAMSAVRLDCFTGAAMAMTKGRSSRSSATSWKRRLSFITKMANHFRQLPPGSDWQKKLRGSRMWTFQLEASQSDDPDFLAFIEDLINGAAR